MTHEFHAAAQECKAWAFDEARRLLQRIGRLPAPPQNVIFETGYGPSGLPHIGTFGEVARTSMVRHAFSLLSDLPTRLICFSDDMDGLRKVPDNLPQQEMIAANLGRPLTRIPDPFGEAESFGHYMNAKLRRFLDAFGFEYEFLSATECYTSGRFNATLRKVLEHYDAVINVILPTLGEERQKTYSPFLPVCPETGIVLQVPVVARNVEAGTITYRREDGKEVETPVTDGHCKLQWKADWAMRWAALGVDYEMSGKDLTPSVQLSSKICRILGSTPPEGFAYELFLDENGQKISKSKGNGLTIDEWLRYAPTESLSYYMFQAPKKAKRLYFDVIPKNVDEYVQSVERYHAEPDAAKRLNNAAWHIHHGEVPQHHVPVSFNMLLNLASACNPEDASVLRGFIASYPAAAGALEDPFFERLIDGALAYFRDFILPNKRYKQPDATEAAALKALDAALAALPHDTHDVEAITQLVYDIGKAHYSELKDWFAALYHTLLGQEQGPRMGSFIALYGVAETRALIARALRGELQAA